MPLYAVQNNHKCGENKYEILIDVANEWGRGSRISIGGVSTTISIVEIVLGKRCNSCR